MLRYSRTSLVKKLGIKESFKLYIKNSPKNYLQLIGTLPNDVKIIKGPSEGLDMVHFFTTRRKELAAHLDNLRGKIKQNGMIWVSWPKKTSKVPTDVTEDVIRNIALPIGLVDVKVCAVDDTWSGVKLVIRKDYRK